MSLPALRLDYGPAATTKLDGELFGSNMAYELLLRGPSPFRNRDRLAWMELCVLQPVNERVGLLTSEPTRSLTLSESHRATCVPKVAMARALKKFEQLLHLPARRWRS